MEIRFWGKPSRNKSSEALEKYLLGRLRHPHLQTELRKQLSGEGKVELILFEDRGVGRGFPL